MHLRRLFSDFCRANRKRSEEWAVPAAFSKKSGQRTDKSALPLSLLVEFEGGTVYLLSLKVVPSLVSTSSTPRSLNSLRIRSASA